MVKSVFYRLIGRTTESIPYGTQDEEQSLHVVTPVKYATVLEQSVIATTVVSNCATESVGFVQKFRNSLRRKKKNRDYDLFADRPSPFKTPPPFLREKPAELSVPQNWDSPFGLEVLEECIKKKKAGQKPFKIDFSGDSQEEEPTHSHSTLSENEENGSPSVAGDQSAPTAENIGFDPEDLSIDAYFKTPDGIRKYHRRSKVFLSVKEDHLI